MNVKTMIELPEHQMRYAEKMVEEGQYPSIDSVLAASMDEMMRNAPRKGDDPVAAMADELRRRMELPRDQWISMEDDDLFERVRARIAARAVR